MEIIEYKTKFELLAKASVLFRIEDLLYTDTSISFRIYENRQTKELHIWKR